MNPLLLAKLIGSAALCLVLAGGGAYAGYRWESGEVATLKAQQATFVATAKADAARQQRAQDDITAQISTRQAAAQTKVITRTNTIIKEIPSHVSNNVHCISYGLVRVLNGAAGPTAYPVPGAASQPDDTCAPVTWRELASDIADDYGSADQNAVEIDGLQDWVKQQEAISPQTGGR